MESIGEKLKTAREEKGYSPDQVARDTNIARRFILAMEQEEFSAFPGDTYLLGFLRNYADYLGLDSERLVTLYRNTKIQEQPVPMEELIQGKKRSPSIGLIIGIVAGLLVLAGGGYGLYTWFSQNGGTAEIAKDQAEPAEQATAEAETESAGQRYEMDEEIVERRFQEGQVLRLMLDNDTVDIEVSEVGSEITLTTPYGSSTVGLGKELLLDLTQDARNDIRIVVQDIDAQGRTAVLRFDRGLGRSAEAAIDETTVSHSAQEDEEEAIFDLGTTSVDSRTQTPVTILTAEQPEAFRLDVNFRGYSLVRYLKDDEIREQRYFNKDDTFRLNVDREVMLWISNAGSFQARIGGQEVDFGGPGEVSTKLLRWERSEETGRYQLRMLPVY
ncbi:MAG: helix-turn-helix domain-containing protein [bacterium]